MLIAFEAVLCFNGAGLIDLKKEDERAQVRNVDEVVQWLTALKRSGRRSDMFAKVTKLLGRHYRIPLSYLSVLDQLAKGEEVPARDDPTHLLESLYKKFAEAGPNRKVSADELSSLHELFKEKQR